MFERYGAWVARHAKASLLVAGLVVVAAAVLGLGAFGTLRSGGFDDPNAPSSRAQAVLATRFHGGANLILLVGVRTGDVDSPAARQAGTDLATRLAAEPTVARVLSYWTSGAPALRSTDGTRALVVAQVTSDGDRILARYDRSTPELTVAAGGALAADRDVNGAVLVSLGIAEAIAVPLTMLLLVLAFESLVAAAVPMLIGTAAIMGTFGELYLLGSLTDVSIYAVNLTTAMGLGLGIDYALLLVSRFREELAAGRAVPEAVARTVATAGRTIVFSAATVAVALASLLVFPLYFLRSFAYAGIGVVVIAAAAALVLAPAMLALLGPRINAGLMPWARQVRGPSSRLWERIAAGVTRRPVLAALPVLVLLLVAAAPLAHLTFGTPDEGVLRPGVGTRQVADAMRTGFPGTAATPIQVVLAGPVPAEALAGYAARISALPGVVRVDGPTASYQAGVPGPAGPTAAELAGDGAVQLSVATTAAGKSAAAQQLVRDVRAVPAPPGTTPLVGGRDAELVDTTAAIGARLPYAVGLVLVTTFVLLFLFTGGLLQPLRALLLGALSLAATLGAMTWIFQDGHLAGLLGFTPRPMDTSMTVLLFCIAFGLSMDYEVFVTSRIKEQFDRDGDPVTATVAGLARSGRIVSTAAGLLAVGFFAFGTATVSFLQMFGLGSGLAILIDATLVRGVLIPAVLRLGGRAMWWAPAPLRRLRTRFAPREA